MHRLRSNSLGDDGTITICKALSESKVSQLQELDLFKNDIGPPGAEALGNMLLVRTSLTSIDLSFNDMGGRFYVKPEALSGSPLEEGTKVHYQGQEVTILQEEDEDGEIEITNIGILALANALRVSTSSLTSVWTPAHETEPRPTAFPAC